MRFNRSKPRIRMHNQATHRCFYAANKENRERKRDSPFPPLSSVEKYPGLT